MGYKDKRKRREYQKEYQKKWRELNKDKWKLIQKKAEEKEERKEYRRKWWNESPKAKIIKERFKEMNPNIQKIYEKNYKERNPERAIKKYQKYYDSIKGVVNRLKKSDKKRFGIENNEITEELISYIDTKFKDCWYCGEDFKPRFDYDHLNPFKPFSKNNIIKVCSKCNQSKSNSNLLEWMKFKEYEISKELLEIYNKAYS